MEHVYLTNEKLISLRQQQNILYSAAGSRSSSVSRLHQFTQRNTHDPLHNPDLMTKLEDILKARVKQPHKSRHQHNSQCDNLSHDLTKVLSQIDPNTFKSPIRPTVQPTFLNYAADNNKGVHKVQKQKSSINLVKEDEKILQRRESLKKFKDEFNSMQQKIRSRNNSVVNEDIDMKKTNQQLQTTITHLQQQLEIEQNQNQKLNSLVTNLNQQLNNTNKQLGDTQQQLWQLQTQGVLETKTLTQLNNGLQKQLSECQEQLSAYSEIQQSMEQLEQVFNSMTELGPEVNAHHQITIEIRELLKIQHNIIDKVVHQRDMPIDQLLMKKSTKKKSGIQIQIVDQAIETTVMLKSICSQLQSQVDLLTERFIHDLLV